MKEDKTTSLLSDCMEFMKDVPDKYFELAIVDPPYGLGLSNKSKYTNKSLTIYIPKDWDNSIPNKDYFNELFRVSQNQVIWGGNYFTELIPASRSWIFWDKKNCINNYSDGELAWTSFDRVTKKVEIQQAGFLRSDPIRIHVTQKPIKLYEWVLMNYAKKGDKILDTHLGSGSSRIAAYNLGFEFIGTEMDEDYYKSQEDRFKDHISQLTLF